MNKSTIEFSEFKLRRISGSAYYVLIIQMMEGRYYLIKRSGKMGAPYTRAPFFDGWPIGSKIGYLNLDDAMFDARTAINKKLNQKDERQYVKILTDEALLVGSDGSYHLSEIQREAL
jgi:hypothetical protein